MTLMDNEELETYGDTGITSKDAPVPTWLKWVYVTLPIFGILALIVYWNGSQGWLDRGYWFQLQTAANTTYPVVNWNEVESQNEKSTR